MISTLVPGTPTKSDEHVKGCPCWCQDVQRCSDMVRAQNAENFETDLEEIANSLMKVMTICRLRPWEVRRTKEPIKRAFRYYEELRYRVNRVPNKRFAKENFLHDLATEAGMNRIDSQLAYGITKRAFRAYYYGSGEGGQRLMSLLKQQRHRAECIWLHAAKRTAEILAVYMGLLYSEEYQYAKCIECVYKTLYEDLQSRMVYEDSDKRVCTCGDINLADPNPLNGPWTKDGKEAVDSASVQAADSASVQAADSASVQAKISARSIKTMELFINDQAMHTSKPPSSVSMHMEYTMQLMEEIVGKMDESSNPTKPTSKTSEKSTYNKRSKKKGRRKCTCPSMQCNREHLDPIITAECSQGPFICRWLPYDEDDEKPPRHCVPTTVLVCPPCEDEVSCDEECTCTCQICTCPPAYADIVEEEGGEKVSNTGVEDHDTDFCYVAPFRDFPRADPVEEEALSEKQEQRCTCACKYKQRHFPHLFTYVAPIKRIKQIVQPPIVQPENPQIPLSGISMATYRCWNEPSESISTDSPVYPICPYITLLSAQKPAGMTIDVTVKTQKTSTQTTAAVKKSTIAALENKPAPKPAPAPAPARSPGPPARAARPPANPPDDEKLTQDDIIGMIGLGVQKGK